MQMYDFFMNAVSLAYGKCAKEERLEALKNQRVMENSTQYPMEK